MDTHATRFHCPHRDHDPLIEPHGNSVAVIRQLPLSDGRGYAIEVWVHVSHASAAIADDSRFLRACYYGEANKTVH